MAVLQNVPALVILFVGVAMALLALPYLRKLTEKAKVAYLLSFSASYGDVALTVVVALGAVLAPRFTTGVFIFDPWFNVILIGGLFIVGVMFQRKPDASQEVTDKGHSYLVIPLVGYFVVIAELVIIQSGYLFTYFIGAACPVLWYLFVRRDETEERLQQWKYFLRTGETAVPGLGWLIDWMNRGVDLDAIRSEYT